MALTASTMLELGTVAPDFTLAAPDGKTYRLAEQKIDTGLLVIFMCNHCPYVIHIREKLVETIRHYQQQGITVVAINANDYAAHPDDSPENMVRDAEAYNFSFPYLVDETQEIAKAYGATNTPHMYILRKESGKLRVNYIGAIDNNPREPKNVTKKYIREALNALLDGHEVPVKETKAIGCGIKWKSA